MRRRTRVLAAGVALVVPAAVGAQSAGSMEPRSYEVDFAASQLYVVVHKAGLLSFLGHDHAIVPTEWSADLCLSDPLSAGAHARVTVETGSLVIDSDSARALAGLTGGPGDDERRYLHAEMLDSTHLNAERYPEVRLDLRAAEGDGDPEQVTVRGSITLRGVTRDVEIPVDVERRDDRKVLLSGSLRIRMRDFGMEPESRAGVVKVSNDVDLHFALVAAQTSETCTAAYRR